MTFDHLQTRTRERDLSSHAAIIVSIGEPAIGNRSMGNMKTKMFVKMTYSRFLDRMAA